MQYGLGTNARLGTLEGITSVPAIQMLPFYTNWATETSVELYRFSGVHFTGIALKEVALPNKKLLKLRKRLGMLASRYSYVSR